MKCKIIDIASGSYYDAEDYLNRISELNKNAALKLSTLKGKDIKEKHKSKFKWNKEQLNAQQKGIDFVKEDDFEIVEVDWIDPITGNNIGTHELTLKVGNQFMLIDGKAGTGKTTIAQEIFREFPHHSKTIVTISDQAKKVLVEKLEEGGISNVKGLNFAQLIPTSKDNTISSESYLKNFYKVMENEGILLADEASMISEDLFAKIMTNKNAKLKVFFLGDIGQVSPIREGYNSDEKSPVFKLNKEHVEIFKSDNVRPFLINSSDPDYYTFFPNADRDLNLNSWISYNEALSTNHYQFEAHNILKIKNFEKLLDTNIEFENATLKTRVRQGEGSPILDYADRFHSNTQPGIQPNPMWQVAPIDAKHSKISDKGSVLFVNSLYQSDGSINPRIIEAYKNIYNFDSDKNIIGIKNQNFIKACFYTNAAVDNFNDKIRSSLFKKEELEIVKNGKTIKIPFVQNELFMSYKKVTLDKYKYNTDEKKSVVIENNQVMKIDSVEYVGQEKITLRVYEGMVNLYRIRTKTEDGTKVMFYTHDAPDVVEDGTVKSKFPNTFTTADSSEIFKIKPIYASTIHKAQGSTYDITIVDESDIENSGDLTSDKQKSELMYTGITRSRNITILSNKKIKDQTVKAQDTNGFLSGDTLAKDINITSLTKKIDDYKSNNNPNSELNTNVSDSKGEYKFLDIANGAPNISVIKQSFESLMTAFDISENSDMGQIFDILNDVSKESEESRINTIQQFNNTLVRKNTKFLTLQDYYKYMEGMYRALTSTKVTKEQRQFILTGLFMAAINKADGLALIAEGMNKKGSSQEFMLSLTNTQSKNKDLHNLTLEAISNAYRFIKSEQSTTNKQKWLDNLSRSLTQFTTENNTEAIIKKTESDLFEKLKLKNFTDEDIKMIMDMVKEENNPNNNKSLCE